MVNITPVAKAAAFKNAITRRAKPKPINISPIEKVGKTRKYGTKPGEYRISPVEKPGKPKDTYGQGPKEQKSNAEINKYLTNDTTYQQQIAAINKALGDYTANEANSEVQYNNVYGQNLYDLGQERNQSSIDQKNDYAARGFLRSGGHAVANSDLLNRFASRQSALDMNRGAFLQNARGDLANFKSSQALSQQQARQDAINRRALGLLGGS